VQIVKVLQRKDNMRDEEGSGRGGDRGERRGMNPNYFLPKPVKVGDVLEVTIEGQASRGDGIAKKDGFVIFVKGAKPGDKLTVKITDVRTRFAIGEPAGAAPSA
jgi:predicted RNA-binding protein with TRAM domain